MCEYSTQSCISYLATELLNLGDLGLIYIHTVSLSPCYLRLIFTSETSPSTVLFIAILPLIRFRAIYCKSLTTVHAQVEDDTRSN